MREACDKVLKDKTVPENVLTSRAKVIRHPPEIDSHMNFFFQGMLVIGAIFKATVPDESDEERRELERMVAEAALPRKKAKHRASPPPIVKA